MSAAALVAAIAAIAACLGARELASDFAGRRAARTGGDRGRRARFNDRRARAGLGSRDWLALKGACAVICTVTALALAAASPGRVTLLLMVAAPVAGFMAPDHYLSRLSRRRLDAALRELPDMLDLLRVAVEAGMAPARALGVVAHEFHGPLAREWRRVAAETALGIPRDQALAGLAERLPADEVASFVEALVRSNRYGVPLGRAIAAQAAAARHARRRLIHERAAQAGPKIQLVVALMLVPAVLLMVAAGIVAEIERSGLGFPG